MKPRIRAKGKCAWIGMMIYCPGYECTGNGHTGWGVTPAYAYTAWNSQEMNQPLQQYNQDVEAAWRYAHRKVGFFERWFG